MFIGREKELKQLNRYYEMDSFQFPVIYGRRRVGKTALINEFTKDKDKIFYTAIESNLKQNLENFSRSIFEYENKLGKMPIFQNFQDALEYIFECSINKRIILVIDEYPYLAKICKEISSILQILIDKYKDNSKLFLILCGSSMSFMEEQVLGYQSPLYGRRTSQFKILPFDFYESCKFLEGFNNYEKAMIYGITGGTPQYLLKINKKMTFEENIKENIINISSYLFEEPNNLLKQEVREANFYNSIISAVATGSTKLNEISSKVGEESGKVTNSINKLIQLGILRKETPIGNKSNRKTIYIVDDNLFNFWYRFILPNMSIIQNDMIDVAYERIMSQMSMYMGYIFEEICKQYMWRLNIKNETPFVFTELGKWWGNDPIRKEETEIDIMATDGNDLIVGECKWKNELIDIDVLEKIMDRKRLFHNNKIYIYIFSKTGFTDKCIKYAKANNIQLISFDEMIKKW